MERSGCRVSPLGCQRLAGAEPGQSEPDGDTRGAEPVGGGAFAGCGQSRLHRPGEGASLLQSASVDRRQTQEGGWHSGSDSGTAVSLSMEKVIHDLFPLETTLKQPRCFRVVFRRIRRRGTCSTACEAHDQDARLMPDKRHVPNSSKAHLRAFEGPVTAPLSRREACLLRVRRAGVFPAISAKHGLRMALTQRRACGPPRGRWAAPLQRATNPGWTNRSGGNATWKVRTAAAEPPQAA